MRSGLQQPLDFPPLSNLVVAGDRVVVAVDPEAPRASSLVAGIVTALLETAVEARDITVLLARSDQLAESWRATLPAAALDVQAVQHDPDDRQQLSYLAATKDAAPIVLSRYLCDADVVIPVNLVRPRSSLLYTGGHGGLCPSFADVSTQRRFRTPNSAFSVRQQQRRQEEADEVAWLLGVQLSVVAVAGAGDSLCHLLVGLDEEVVRAGQLLARDTWCHALPQRAELVVAAIPSDSCPCDWNDLARALHAAQQACLPDGTIVLCTDLDCPPGPALRRLAGLDDTDRLLQRLGNDKSSDAIIAWSLAEAARPQPHLFTEPAG